MSDVVEEPDREAPASGRAEAKRTLMKSAPELWEVADDSRRQGVWLAMLIGERDPIAVEVTRREQERRLAWRSTRDPEASIELEFAEGGFGTVVTARASFAGAGDHAALESMIDDLGSVERRPFSAA